MSKRHKGKGAWGNKPRKPLWEDTPHSRNISLGILELPQGYIGVKTCVSNDEEMDLNERLTILHQSCFGGKIVEDMTFRNVGMESPLDLYFTFEKYDVARMGRRKADAAYHLSKLLGLSVRKSVQE
ncbi:MAG: hypothetical protein HZB10_02350 [Candidatus Yonathbacteria bacterium]|nr:hypothetical protein [Candidatus Yonathbacteria bacterium]